jgi:hypothetical protein
MIIPSFNQATSAVTYGADVLNKWYVSYFEEFRGMKFSRYLTPQGWKRTAHWFDSREEAEKVFQKYNQSCLSVSAIEYESEIEFRREYEQERERYFHEEMQNWMNEQLRLDSENKNPAWLELKLAERI